MEFHMVRRKEKEKKGSLKQSKKKKTGNFRKDGTNVEHKITLKKLVKIYQ